MKRLGLFLTLVFVAASPSWAGLTLTGGFALADIEFGFVASDSDFLGHPFDASVDDTFLSIGASGDEVEFHGLAGGHAELTSPTTATVSAFGDLTGEVLPPTVETLENHTARVAASAKLDLLIDTPHAWSLDFSSSPASGLSDLGNIHAHATAFLSGVGAIFEAGEIGPLGPTTYNGVAGTYTLELLVEVETQLELDFGAVFGEAHNFIDLDATFTDAGPVVPLPSSILLAAMGAVGLRRIRWFSR